MLPALCRLSSPQSNMLLIRCSPMDEKTPDGFPPLTLLIMRTLCALTVLYPGSQGQGKLTKALDALYHAYWVEHKKTNEKEVLAGILGKVLGEEDAEKGRWLPDSGGVSGFWLEIDVLTL
jgi:hypothetical protein